MSALAQWILGGGLALLLGNIATLVTALKAHGRIGRVEQQQGKSGSAPPAAPPAA